MCHHESNDRWRVSFGVSNLRRSASTSFYHVNNSQIKLKAKFRVWRHHNINQWFCFEIHTFQTGNSRLNAHIVPYVFIGLISAVGRMIQGVLLPHFVGRKAFYRRIILHCQRYVLGIHMNYICTLMDWTRSTIILNKVRHFNAITYSYISYLVIWVWIWRYRNMYIPILSELLHVREPGLDRGPHSLKATAPYIYIYYFCTDGTWEHVSVHWQQGNYQLWADCFRCWNLV